jgi:predicted molibdopterin-dependent oxidoreductase YjgC
VCIHGGFLFLYKGGKQMSREIITVHINGNEYKAASGSTILEIINQQSIEHPQICYVPEVDPIQTCDTCIVEMKKWILFKLVTHVSLK